jgi:hypothetical protein
MKIIVLSVALAVLLTGCSKKKPEAGMDELMKQNPHAGLDMKNMPKGMGMENPHGQMAETGGLDLDAMLANLPQGWTKAQPTSSMRLAQIALAPAKGDAEAGEIAIFHFPGSGGSAAANIERWQNQFSGPNGEPGMQVAKTDTMMVGLLTVVTTDVSGMQLASSAMTGEGKDKPGMRMIASVIETPSGNWFIKCVGPTKTIAAHESKIRDFVKRAKMKDGGAMQ